MQEVKILHISDMHLGSTFAILDSDAANLRRIEMAHTSIKAINDAADCDLVLLSGDVFDSAIVPLALLDSFLSAIESLGSIPVFYSCGNHDSYHTDAVKYCIKNSPENLHIFLPDKITSFTLDELNVRVYGASFSSEHCDFSMLDDVPQLDDDYINILCMHGDVQPGVYNYINPNELKKTKFTYAALGHIHAFGGIQKTGTCYYAYSGIPEGRGFDECGDKGYIKGYISKNNVNLAFCPAAKRKYIDEKIDISDFKNEFELIDVLNSLCNKGDDICRFTLVGENNFGKAIDINLINSQLNAYFSLCIDCTKASVSPEDYHGFSGLKGICANETLKLMDKAQTDDEKEKYKKAFGLLVELLENR